MDKRFSIIANGREKKVSGEVTEYFGIYSEVSRGWKIVHLLSGCLLTRACYRTSKDAKEFVQLVESVFGEHLAHPAPDVLSIAKNQVERGLEIWSLTYELEGIDHLVTMKDVERILNDRSAGTIFDGPEQGESIGGDPAFGEGEYVSMSGGRSGVFSGNS